jgi:MoaA/NifB/PqqE/SkfB family radical SAM enzyme
MSRPESVYSGLKILAYPERVRLAREGAPVPPVHVNIDLTDYCTQACGFCMYQSAFSLGGQTREMGDLTSRLDGSRLRRLVGEFVRAGVEGVEITGGGEPTAHREFDRFALDLLAAGIKIGVITNGDLLERHFEALRQATFVRVSVSSLDESRHAAIRRPKLPRRVGDTMKHLATLCGLPGPADREIGIGFTIGRDNVGEIVEVCRGARAAGCTNVRLTMTWVDDPTAEYPPALEASVAEEVARARRLESARFRIYGPDEWRAYQLEALPGHGKRYRACAYAFFVINITADGRCWPCCVQRHVPGWSFGNIFERSFDDIALGGARNGFVRDIDVRRCMPCIWSPRNEAMEPYVFGEAELPSTPRPARHQEFV